MTETDLQVGGGYTYQWECAILLALNYFFDPVRYNPTLFDLVEDFLGQVAVIQLEGEDRESGVDLEDISLVNGGRRILIQVKTKQAEGERWTPTDPLLLKALYKFHGNRTLAEQPDDTRFMFLTNRPFNPDLARMAAAIREGGLEESAEADALYGHLERYAAKAKGASTDGWKAVDASGFRHMLERTALVEYLAVDAVKANVQAKLQAHGRRDWSGAHARLFEHFARQSTLKGGGSVTRASVVEVLGLPAALRRQRDGAALFAGVPAMPPHFVGRDDQMARLADRVTTGDAHYLALEGPPGVGKTTLAAALAHQPEVLDHFEDGVLWASLGPPDQANPARALAGWAEALGSDVTHLPGLEERRDAVKNQIGQRRLLLVVDDAWEMRAAQALRCGGPNCRHLLTSRDGGLARRFAGARQVEAVSPLADDPAYGLLQALAPEACRADPGAAWELARVVGGLPLAVELLGGYLAVPERSLFPELSAAALAELDDPDRRLALAGRRLGGGDREVSLEATIALSLEALPEAARAAFHALGAFAPRPERFSLAAAQAVAETDARTLAVLAARNLVETEGESLALHQVLAAVARPDPEAAARHRAYHLAMVNEDREDWPRIEAAYGQIKRAWDSTPSDTSRLDWVWALRNHHVRRGLWRDQIEWIQAGLKLARAEGHRTDEATLLNNIGLVYDNLGQRDKALDFYQRALPIREEVGDRAGLAVTLNNIGGVYRGLGQPDKALDFYQRALPIREEVGDRYGESVTRYNLAMLYRSQGRLAEAAAELRRVVELDRLVQHPDLKSDTAMLAQVEAELARQEPGD